MRRSRVKRASRVGPSRPRSAETGRHRAGRMTRTARASRPSAMAAAACAGVIRLSIGLGERAEQLHDDRVLVDAAGDHVGLHEREVRRQDGDAVVGELHPEPAPELLDGRLAHGVRDRAHAVEEGEHRADQDDLALDGDDLRQGRGDGVRDAGHVDGQRGLDVGGRACCAGWPPWRAARRWRSRRRGGRSGRRSARPLPRARRGRGRRRRTRARWSGAARRRGRGVVGSMSAIATLAPRSSSARAVAAPIPPLPPVIRTTLPARSYDCAAHCETPARRERDPAVAAQHRHAGAQRTAVQVRLLAAGEPVHLVGRSSSG